MCWEELSDNHRPPRNPFREIRLHRGKPPQEFVCQLLHREGGYLVLGYHLDRPVTIGGSNLEKGSSTIAHYWQNRQYVLWLFRGTDHTVAGYLFHIVTNLEIGPDFIRYEDLELDIWFDHHGHHRLLDQDELNDCARRGLITPGELTLIEQQKKAVITHFKQIIGEVWSEERL